MAMSPSTSYTVARASNGRSKLNCRIHLHCRDERQPRGVNRDLIEKDLLTFTTTSDAEEQNRICKSNVKLAIPTTKL